MQLLKLYVYDSEFFYDGVVLILLPFEEDISDFLVFFHMLKLATKKKWPNHFSIGELKENDKVFFFVKRNLCQHFKHFKRQQIFWRTYRTLNLFVSLMNDLFLDFTLTSF